VATFERAVDETRAQIATLSEKARTAAADQKPAIEKAIGELQTELMQLEGKLGDLKSAAATEWQKVAGEVESGLSSLKRSAASALERFK